MDKNKAALKPNNAEKIADIMKGLSDDVSLRTKKSLISDLLPLINKARKKGISHRKILSYLRENGVDVTLKNFEMILYRLKKTADKRGVTDENFNFQIPSLDSSKSEAPIPSNFENTTKKENEDVGRPKTFDWNSLKNKKPNW